MADTPISVAGDDSFILGANSFISPGKLRPGEYVMGMNLINRGGVAQTRPGSASLPFSIIGTNIQGITLFKPTTGPSSLVFVIDGAVYSSPAPFKTYSRINGITFSKYSKYVTWASCVQSSDYTDDGIFYALESPRNVLIMQDGSTRAAYWDGSSAGHIDPTPSNAEFTSPGRDGTPVGLWMYWSNNRLWVSRGAKIFSSDIGNPLKFTESQYLNEGRAFYLPGDCTGIAETADQQGIICFTAESGVFIKSSIQDRTQWLSTQDFQRTVLPNIGCTSPRSIVQQYGLIWWMTPRGLINQNDAARLNVSSRLNVQDQEMLQSKSNVSYDISSVAGTFYENFLLHAVPNGDRINTRIHVLDQGPLDVESINSWPSYWEGWRPVEFARGIVTSQERLFTISYDYDGLVRIWELFRPERTDNGIPITCYLETKLHYFESRDLKRFSYAEVDLVNIGGDVAVSIAAAGVKGGYQTVGVRDISSTEGQLYDDVQYGSGESDFFGSRKQTRTIKTVDSPPPSDCNSECIESDHPGLIDRAFSLLIVWSGVAGVSAYRIFSRFEPATLQGECNDDETGETRLLTPDGCSSTDAISDRTSFTTYIATATFNKINPSTGLVVTKTSSQSSVISQEDANRKASRTAQWYVMREIGEFI